MSQVAWNSLRGQGSLRHLLILYFFTNNSNNQNSGYHRSNVKTCRGILIKPFHSVKVIQALYINTKTKQVFWRQQQSRDTLVRGDVAAVMEVKESQRDWLALLSLVILMSSLSSQRVISPETRLCLPLKASFLFSQLCYRMVGDAGPGEMNAPHSHTWTESFEAAQPTFSSASQRCSADTQRHRNKRLGQAHTCTRGRAAWTGSHPNVILSWLKWWELDLR